MKEYQLITPYPCIVKFEKEEFFLEENESLYFENENFIYVFPMVENRYFSRHFQINLTKDSKNYKILHKNGEKSVIFLNFQPHHIVYKLEEVVIGKTKCQIKISQSYITISCDSNEIDIEIQEDFENFKILTIDNFVIINLLSKGFEKFLCYNILTNVIYEIKGKEIRIENKKIYSENFVNSKLRQTIYKINKEEIEIENEIFESTTPPQIQSEKLIPFIFLDNIKSKNYNSSFSMLSNELQDNINIDLLKKYFGKVKTFIPLSDTKYLVCSNDKINIFTFKISNQKIIDIEQDD